jgi:hypothetical protein
MVKAMKKTIGILVAAVVLLAMLPIAAIATPSRQLVERQRVAVSEQYPGALGYYKMQYAKQSREQRELNNQKFRFRGVWGFAGDNESDGYVTGVIIKGRRVARLYGVWEETNDSQRRGKIFGILKRGYFNGKVIVENGTTHRIVGIYKIDREHRLLKMRWMMPRCSGWAILKLGRYGTDETILRVGEI